LTDVGDDQIFQRPPRGNAQHVRHSVDVAQHVDVVAGVGSPPASESVLVPILDGRLESSKRDPPPGAFSATKGFLLDMEGGGSLLIVLPKKIIITFTQDAYQFIHARHLSSLSLWKLKLSPSPGGRHQKADDESALRW